MRKKITRQQIAERAGVSIATVDRVVNSRAAVRRVTVSKVEAAAESLGYGALRSNSALKTNAPVRCGFLLQRSSSLFYQRLANELQQVLRLNPDLPAQLTIEFTDDYLDPSKVAQKMGLLGAKVDSLAVVATESPYISQAIDTLKEQEVPVVALLTDLSAGNLTGYVGIDNRMAGRTAAWVIAHCGRVGSVGVLIGSHGYLGQEDREIGFRTFFREKAPAFKVLEPQVCKDVPEVAYEQTIELLENTKDLVGIYTVGGGRTGTMRALAERLPQPMPAHVCHELNSLTRPGLVDGTVDVIIDHDLDQLAKSAIEMLIDVKITDPGNKRSSVVPFMIYTSENI